MLFRSGTIIVTEYLYKDQELLFERPGRGDSPLLSNVRGSIILPDEVNELVRDDVPFLTIGVV